MPKISEQIQFYHKSLWSPKLHILVKAVNAKYITTFPQFTSKQIRKISSNIEATMLGHMHTKPGKFKKKKLLANTKITPPHPYTTSSPRLIEDGEPPEIPRPVRPIQQPPNKAPQPPLPVKSATLASHERFF